jgi:glycosyltransferase involved in cell wall biosynthesis
MDNILQQKRKMERRGKNEIDALKLVKNVGGRTEWDYTCTEIINANRRYFHIGESLRKEFYTDQWDIEQCEKHSIFVSQCSYTIKGFHLLLDAVNILKRKFPDIKVYTTGQSVMNGNFNIRENSYAKFLRKKIEKFNINDKVFFCGQLDADGMKERYLRANVFVSPSLIENSSNSIGEAMLIGCPVVSSLVGGVSDFITDGVEGLLYQSSAPYMLAQKIAQIFNNNELANNLSINARKKAQLLFDQDRNVQELLTAYDLIKE